jgi:hypothetical protein
MIKAFHEERATYEKETDFFARMANSICPEIFSLE